MAARAAGVPDAAPFARLRLERRTTMSCAGAGRIAWSGPSPRARPPHIKPLAKLAAAGQEALAFVDELGLERLELALAAPDELELRVDVGERGLQDAQPLAVGLRLVEPAAQCGPRFLCLDQLLQLVERDVQQVAKPGELLQPLDVALVVRAMLALAPL